jgi:hypothetical protein
LRRDLACQPSVRQCCRSACHRSTPSAATPSVALVGPAQPAPLIGGGGAEDV